MKNSLGRSLILVEGGRERHGGYIDTWFMVLGAALYALLLFLWLLSLLCRWVEAPAAGLAPPGGGGGGEALSVAVTTALRPPFLGNSVH